MIKNKQKILLEQDVRVFRTADLAVLWEAEKRSTLWVTISRYLDKEILYSIYKGLYSTVPVEKLDTFELGCALCGEFSYISGETVLQKKGVIMQQSSNIILFGKKSNTFKITGKIFVCKYLNPRYLYNRNGILDTKRYSIATPERALSDKRKNNPLYYVDTEQSLDKKKLQEISQEVYGNSTSRK